MSLIQLIAVPFGLLVSSLGADLDTRIPAGDRGSLPIVVVYVANCSCTPTLESTELDCGPFTLGPCIAVTVTPGTPNSPLCNDVEGCPTLVNCDATTGTVALTYNSGPECTNSCSVFTVSKNGVGAGSFTSSGAATVLMKVGGSPVACTSADNREFTGDTISIACGTGATECSFTVTDVCLKCGGCDADEEEE